MKFHAIINNPKTKFFDSNNNVILEIKRIKKYFNLLGVKTAAILDYNQNKIVEFQYEYSFFRKPKFEIVSQNLKDKIHFKIDNGLFCLKVNNQNISITKKNKIIGFYEGKFISNQIDIGNITQTGKIIGPSTYNFEFISENEINYYCLILFAIYSIDFYAGD